MRWITVDFSALYPNAPDIEENYKPSPPIEAPNARWMTFTTKCDKELKPSIQKELEDLWPLDSG
jgi:hypothetical protein